MKSQKEMMQTLGIVGYNKDSSINLCGGFIHL
jgi:hypothetical protein